MQTTWGKMVKIWWVSSPAKAFLATLGLHITSVHYSTQPVHVPRGGARINVSGLAKNFLFCWQVHFIAFPMLVSSIPILHRNEINKFLKTITEEFVFLEPTAAKSRTFPHSSVIASKRNCLEWSGNSWLSYCNLLFHLYIAQITLSPKDLHLNSLEFLKASFPTIVPFSYSQDSKHWCWRCCSIQLLDRLNICYSLNSASANPAERRIHNLFLLQGWQQFLGKPEADKPAQEALWTEWCLGCCFTNSLSLKKYNAPGKGYQCNPKKEHIRSAITGQ